jgi:hypothetical protein
MMSNRRKIVLGLGVGLLLLAITGVAFAAGTVWGHRLTTRLGLRPQLQVAEKSPSCPTSQSLSTLLLLGERPVTPPAERPPGWPGAEAEVPYLLLRSGKHELMIFSGRASPTLKLQLPWPFPRGEESSPRIVLGEVTQVRGDTITVRADGEEQTVHLTECTKIRRGAAQATAADLRPGNRILVSGKAEPDGPLSAETVVILPLEGP